MASPRPRSRRRLTLSATDEFWRAPVAEDLPPSEIGGGGSGDDDDDSVAATIDVDEGEAISLPAAHWQLLSPGPASWEDLKGYDQTPGIGCDEEGYAGDKPSCSGSGLDDSVGPERDGPGPAGVPGGLSLDSDECSSSSDDDSLPSRPGRGRVSFNSSVLVYRIPHASDLSRAQRRRMYTTTLEVRLNKERNKREWRHDGRDWRRATEEWEMRVDMVSGELVHPAHDDRR